MKFKVKRHWWMWVIGILINAFAVRFLSAGQYIVAVVVFIADVVIIFPDASHFRYVIDNKCVTVKRIIYSDIEIPCHVITAVEKATMFTFGGFALKIWESSFGSYKITYYNQAHRLSAVVISPKESRQFLSELELNIDKEIILINNTESAFKKKKDL